MDRPNSQNALVNLNIHAAEIRASIKATAPFSLSRKTFSSTTAPTNRSGAINGGNGTLGLDAGVITLGANQYGIDQFAQLELNATKGILIQGSGV